MKTTRILRTALGMVLLLAPVAIVAQSAGRSNNGSSNHSSNSSTNNSKSTSTTAAKGDLREIAGYQLSKDKLLKLAKACTELNKATQQNPALKKKLEIQENASIDDSARVYDSMPDAAKAIRSAGLTSREFVVGITALLVNSFAIAGKGYGSKEVPEGASKENMAVIEAYQKDPSAPKAQCTFADEDSNDTKDDTKDQ